MGLFDGLKRMLGLTPEGPGSNGRNGDRGGVPDVEMITCEEALARVHDFLDGELGDVPASEVRVHFEMCERCYPHLRLEELYRETMQRAAGRATAPDELKERVAALLAEEGAGG